MSHDFNLFNDFPVNLANFSIIKLRNNFHPFNKSRSLSRNHRNGYKSSDRLKVPSFDLKHPVLANTLCHLKMIADIVSIVRSMDVLIEFNVSEVAFYDKTRFCAFFRRRPQLLKYFSDLIVVFRIVEKIFAYKTLLRNQKFMNPVMSYGQW